MKVIDKMNELVGSVSSKEEIINWAYSNRIVVSSISFEEEFLELDDVVNKFMEEDSYLEYIEDEFMLWDLFLEYEFN